MIHPDEEDSESLLKFYNHNGIVRNKAAEKAKHAHQVATSGGSSVGSSGGPVSVIAHAPSTQLPEHRSGAYSINGILGLQHDPNGNSIKRKRLEDHDENRDLNGHPDDDLKRQRTQYNGDQLYSNLWSSKWNIKDEHKLLSELGGSGGAPTAGQTTYYDAHAGFPPSSASDLYESINTISQSSAQNLYTPSLAGTLGSGSLTPLAPITLHEMKIEAGRITEHSLSPYNSAETSSPYSGVIGMVDGASPGLPLALPPPDHPGSQPASHAGSPDPAGLTVLQPSNGGSTQHYSMLPSFGYSAASTTVVPGSDYAYSTSYSQYGPTYGTYGYGSTTSGLLNTAYFYTNNDLHPQHTSISSMNGTSAEQSSRSPLAATRANSLASANSPTDSGSACLKTEIFNNDLNLL
ncbi:hypothetical protein WA026_013792 [Henosepilachna vigintioctopunctata]|uniref:Uncharacterized protein n=1 Tax=Henosepilachna vigintioctopunctata TaxID=420089 RepID=A0AAW1V1G6_9CUCU